MPVLQDFSERYPGIPLDVHMSDELLDLGDDQFDIVIRGGAQPESRMISRRLDPNRFILAASPAYLAAQGTPTRLKTWPVISHFCNAARAAYSNGLASMVRTGSALQLRRRLSAMTGRHSWPWPVGTGAWCCSLNGACVITYRVRS